MFLHVFTNLKSLQLYQAKVDREISVPEDINTGFPSNQQSLRSTQKQKPLNFKPSHRSIGSVHQSKVLQNFRVQKAQLRDRPSFDVMAPVDPYIGKRIPVAYLSPKDADHVILCGSILIPV